MGNKLALKASLSGNGDLFLIITISLLLTIGVVGFFWLEMAMIPLGIGFIAFVFVRPLTALLIWYVLSPIMDNYLKIPLGAGIPDITFTRLTIITIFGLIILQTVIRNRTIAKLGKIELYMFLFSFLALMGLSIGDNFKTDVQVLLDGYITPFLLFFLIRNLISKPEDIRQFLLANVIAGAYLAIIGIIQFFTDVTVLAPEGFERLTDERASGPFINPEEYGSALSVMSIASIWLFNGERSKFIKIIIVLSLAVQAAAILLTLTRAVWLAYALSLVLISYFIPKYQKILFYLAIVGVLGLVAFLVLGSSNSVVSERSGDIGSIYSRLNLYMTALNTFVRSPILGYGFGSETFYRASREHLTTIANISDSYGTSLSVPHNELLHMLILMGIVGVVLYVSIFKQIYEASQKLYRYFISIGSGWSEGVVFLWAAFSIYILNSLTCDFIFFSYLNSVNYLFAGVLLAMKANSLQFKST